MNATLFARSPLLGQVAPDDLRGLIDNADRCSFAAGRMLFTYGDPGDCVYVIVSGKVKVFLEGGDGGEIVVANRGTGEVLGEMSLLDGRERSASAAAAGDVTALRISRQQFRTWLAEHPAAAWAVLVQLATRLREATDKVGELALLPVEARVARRLWHELAAATGDDAPVVGARARVHQSEMAAALGVTRESVNKHLARLKTRGVISLDAGTVTLHQPDVLRALADAL